MRMGKPKSLKSQEETAKAQWDERYKKEHPYQKARPTAPVLEFFRKYKKELKNSKILDIGCGNGVNLCYIAKSGFKTYGIDISREALAQLRRLLKQKKISANTRQGSFYSLPYADKTFDCVISIRTLQNNDWKSAKKSFSEISRVLKDNGLFLLSVRSTSMRIKIKREDIHDRGITFIPKTGSKAGIMIHHYSRKEIEELATKNSLEILSMRERIKNTKEGRKGHWIVAFRKTAK